MSDQARLFPAPAPGPAHYSFDGATFEPARDAERLSDQLDRVRAWAISREWFTLPELAAALEYPAASIPALSARLRDLRKPRFGAHRVEARFRARGLWEYRVRP